MISGFVQFRQHFSPTNLGNQYFLCWCNIKRGDFALPNKLFEKNIAKKDLNPLKRCLNALGGVVMSTKNSLACVQQLGT
jgi:hypothetical protein